LRTLTYYVAASLDGYIADPDGGYGDFPFDDDFAARFVASLARFDAVVMGRATWEVGVRVGVTNPYPFLDIDKVVISTTLAASPDPAVRVAADPVAELARMKAATGGPIWLCGGSKLAGTLLGAGLLDELEVKQSPVLLGDGIPLFPRARRTTPLRPVSSELHEPTGIRTTRFVPVATR
jgi:dihydrofolate reductase